MADPTPAQRIDAAISLIGPPWSSLLNERCRNVARQHMALLCSQDDGKLSPADLAIQALRRVNVIARKGERGTIVAPSDQWRKAYA